MRKQLLSHFDAITAVITSFKMAAARSGENTRHSQGILCIKPPIWMYQFAVGVTNYPSAEPFCGIVGNWLLKVSRWCDNINFEMQQHGGGGNEICDNYEDVITLCMIFGSQNFGCWYLWIIVIFVYFYLNVFHSPEGVIKCYLSVIS